MEIYYTIIQEIKNHGTIEEPHGKRLLKVALILFADNYNVNANYDDGSCEYPSNGDYSLNFDGVDDYVEVVNWNA